MLLASEPPLATNSCFSKDFLSSFSRDACNSVLSSVSQGTREAADSGFLTQQAGDSQVGSRKTLARVLQPPAPMPE